MQNKTRTQEISALGHFLIQNSSGPVNETCFYTSENQIEIKQLLMSPERDMYRGGGGYGPKSGTFSFLKHSG